MDLQEIFSRSGGLWCGLMVLHFVLSEDSKLRRLLLKIFARWLEVPLLHFIWVACKGPLNFLTANSVIRAILESTGQWNPPWDRRGPPPERPATSPQSPEPTVEYDVDPNALWPDD